MKTWIVLPAYNEEIAIPLLFDALIETLTEIKQEFSIIAVNDGSKDRTGAVIEEYAKRAPVIPLHNNPNMGLAETMKRGLLEAVKRAGAKDVILTMDADNTHPAGLAVRMLRQIKEGNDVVIASRFREGAHVRGVPLHRKWLSIGASWLMRVLFPVPGVRDYTCGYRAYRAKAIKDLVGRYGSQFISERGFSCMVDILLRLREQDLVFAEAPLVLRYDEKPSQSKMRVLQTIFDTLKLVLRRRFSRS